MITIYQRKPRFQSLALALALTCIQRVRQGLAEARKA